YHIERDAMPLKLGAPMTAPQKVGLAVAKGRASYNRANPGKPGLKPPAPHPKTEKDAARRRSFCARSAGQAKMFPKAAKDPSSRLNKARRAWNCS
ncbi:hypothetical protein EBT31_17260, partial [bacterium]|nr:hypothetical protein [bacterium]